MHLHTRNVNTAFLSMVTAISNEGRFSDGENEPLTLVKRPTRNGPVIQVEEPVTITYDRPKERVLFNPSRDANPFFHVYEALWMLAGRNDVTPLAYYNRRMETFSDYKNLLNGAYGYRWRQTKNGIDQLDHLVSHLKKNPQSRRAVLQMWNVQDDLILIDESRDVCCNLSVLFSIREQQVSGMPKAFRNTETGEVKNFFPYRSYLDMTVTNRSNDMIWGMLGANYVHFTFLQEYMAARIGVEVGVYNQFTNNLHVYDNNWKPREWLKDANIYDYGYHIGAGAKPDSLFPLVKSPEAFEKELPRFVEHHLGKIGAGEQENSWTEPFFSEVAGPMLCAFSCYKEKDFHGAFIMVDQIQADDWRFVAQNWILKRQKKGAGS